MLGFVELFAQFQVGAVEILERLLGVTLDGVSGLLVDAGHDLEPSVLIGFDDDVGPLLQQALPVQRGRFD